MAPPTKRTARKRPIEATTATKASSPYKAPSTPSSPRSKKKGAAVAAAAAGKQGEKEERKNSNNKTAFVTVGTTRFDALVRAVDDRAFESALLARGFTRLVVQAGAGGLAPDKLLSSVKEGSKKSARLSSSSSASKATSTTTTTLLPLSGTTAGGLSVEFFDYAPSLKEHFASADLVVSHAGAGSIFETLSISRPPSSSSSSSSSSSCSLSSPPLPLPLIAVPNGALMHDHQSELASELAARGLLVAATPATLAKVLRGADFTKLKRYEREGAQGVADAIDGLSGRREKRGRR